MRVTIARSPADPDWVTAACLSIAAFASLKLLAEASGFLILRAPDHSPEKGSALLLRGALWPQTITRFTTGLLGGVAIPILLANSAHAAPLKASWVAASFALILVAELAERNLFFRAVDRPSMPGSPAS